MGKQEHIEVCQPTKTLGQKSNLPTLVHGSSLPYAAPESFPKPESSACLSPLAGPLLDMAPVEHCLKDLCDLVFAALPSAPAPTCPVIPLLWILIFCRARCAACSLPYGCFCFSPSGLCTWGSHAVYYSCSFSPFKPSSMHHFALNPSWISCFGKGDFPRCTPCLSSSKFPTLNQNSLLGYSISPMRL